MRGGEGGREGGMDGERRRGIKRVRGGGRIEGEERG